MVLDAQAAREEARRIQNEVKQMVEEAVVEGTS